MYTTLRQLTLKLYFVAAHYFYKCNKMFLDDRIEIFAREIFIIEYSMRQREKQKKRKIMSQYLESYIYLFVSPFLFLV